MHKLRPDALALLYVVALAAGSSGCTGPETPGTGDASMPVKDGSLDAQSNDAEVVDARADGESDAAAEPDAQTNLDAAQDDAAPVEDASPDSAAEGDASTVGNPCGGPDHIACAQDELCNIGQPVGAKDTNAKASCLIQDDDWGVCIRKPALSECVALTTSYVCGCNQIAYRNECEAHAQGVSVHYDRNCQLPPNSCGISAGTLGNVSCSDPASSCIPSTCTPGVIAFGSCQQLPATCPDVDQPVCSCGVTYPNACLASKAGVFATEGACPLVPRACGIPFVIGEHVVCEANEYCNTSERCYTGPGVSQRGRGFCEGVPSSCSDQSAPVCGCDGVTYLNACEAHRARASIAKQGPC